MRLMRRLIVVVSDVTALPCASTVPPKNSKKVSEAAGAANIRRKISLTVATPYWHRGSGAD